MDNEQKENVEVVSTNMLPEGYNGKVAPIILSIIACAIAIIVSIFTIPNGITIIQCLNSSTPEGAVSYILGMMLLLPIIFIGLGVSALFEIIALCSTIPSVVRECKCTKKLFKKTLIAVIFCAIALVVIIVNVSVVGVVLQNR